MSRSITIPNTPGKVAAVLRLSGDGSFVYSAVGGKEDKATRVEYRSGRAASVLRLQGRQWLEANVQLLALPRGRPLLKTRVSRPSEDGGIVAYASMKPAIGSRREHTLEIRSGDERFGTIVERHRDGSTLVAKGMARNGISNFTRRRVDRYGKSVWDEEVETKFASPGPGRSEAEPARVVSITRKSAAGTRKRTMEIYCANCMRRSAGSTNRSVARADDGSVTDESVVQNPDGSLTTTTTVTFPDGSSTITIKTEWTSPDGNSSGSETTVYAESSDGSSTVTYHEVAQSSTDPDTGEASSTDTVEITTDQGTTTHEQSWGMDADGNTSQTTIDTGPDGSQTYTTTTADANGAGTETITTYDSSGGETGSSTTSFGDFGGGGDTPGGDPGGGDPGGGGGDPGGGDPGPSGGGGITSGGEPCDPASDDDCTPVMKPSDDTRIVSETLGRVLDSMSNLQGLDTAALSGQTLDAIRRHVRAPALPPGRGAERNPPIIISIGPDEAQAIERRLGSNYSAGSTEAQAHAAYVAALVAAIAQLRSASSVNLSREILSTRKFAARVKGIDAVR